MAIVFDIVKRQETNEVNSNDLPPILVCIPGLLGGPEAFSGFIERWKKHFTVLLLDLNPEKRDEGLTGISNDTLNEVNYNESANEIRDYLLKEYPQHKYYFVGVSLGGKIIYDFLYKFPQLIEHAVTVDVGPGRIDQSELFYFVRKVIRGLNMNLEWRELKRELVQQIPEKNLRILIQTQIYYEDNKPPAKWRKGIMGLEGFISRQTIHNQWPLIDAIDEESKKRKDVFTVLLATTISGIDSEDLKRIRETPLFKVKTVPESTHFMFITHRDVLEQEVVNMLSD